MTTIPNPEAELLRRVVDPQRAGWSAEVSKRPAGDTTVTTSEFVNQMREELGV